MHPGVASLHRQQRGAEHERHHHLQSHGIAAPVRRRLRETILWIGAALGTLCLVWTGVMFAFGLTPLVFTSGSMEPAIGAGDLAFATTVEAVDLAEGDIVSVINDRGTRITHRITKVDRQDDGSAILQLKGDANLSPDQESYRVDDVERVSFAVPEVGRLVNLFGSPNGMFVVGLVVAGLLYLGFRRQDEDDDEPRGPSSGHDGDGDVDGDSSTRGASAVLRPVTMGVSLAALALSATVGPAVQSTTAAFSDSAQLTTGSVGAAALPTRPSSISCSKPFLSTSAVVSWSDDDARHGYYYEVDDDAAFGSPDAEASVAPNGSNSFTFNSGSAGGWFSSTTYHLRVYSALVGPGGALTWRSASYRSYRVTRSAFFNDFSCSAVTSPAN
nr:signal peptidase I [Aeromicrobium phoceense]